MFQISDEKLLRTQCYVNGKWVDADSGAVMPVTNPADGSELGLVPDLSAEEIRRAIDAANSAWGQWRGKTAGERGAVLRRWYDLIMENKEDLARIMTAEQGKPLAESGGKLFTGPRLSTGLPKRENESTVTPSPPISRGRGFWFSGSRSAYARPYPPGISHRP